MSIGEAHQLLTMETEMDIGQSKFAELRPTEVLPMTSNNQEVCICKYHENIDMILQGLTKIKSDKTSRCLSSEEVVTRKVCSLTSEKCIDRNCDKCQVKEAVQQLFDSLDEDCPLSYYQWNTVDGKTKKAN